MRDGPALRNHRASTTTAIGVAAALAASLMAEAGDILRGGAPAATRQGNAGFGNNPAPTAQARANAKDVLSRTTEAVQAVKGMQAAARNAAIQGPNNLGLNPNKPGVQLPNVPNGLTTGGLQVGNTKLWRGATLPTQSVANVRTKVAIKQTKPQALLSWQTFNIGKETTLSFDQSAGGDNQGQWIAFNKVNDPSGVPSQILGSIEGLGQVYVINQNGIIFGGSSQINLHTLVASSLLINDGLIARGLLNNPDAHFLFSNLPIASGKNGTPAFNPVVTDPAFSVDPLNPTRTVSQVVASDGKTPAAPIQFRVSVTRPGTGAATLSPTADYTLATNAAGKSVVTFTPDGLVKVAGGSVKISYTPAAIKSGDVTVQKGAILASPVNDAGNGGRVMLVGPNVENAGTILTPAGQTILAAGLQVGVAAHASNDPSLRGLDVWVGAVGSDTGKATNRGLIDAPTGSISMVGRFVNQLGAAESATSVSLNGRIDLRASYGAVGNPNFTDSTLPFVFQKTGVVTFGEGSVTRILPDYLSERTVPGTTLPESSQINVDGLAIHFSRNSMMLAPSGNIRLSAGLWPYRDVNGDRTTLGSDGLVESGLSTHLAGGEQRFLFDSGQIYLDSSSFINVAGTTDVNVPLSQSLLDVEFRGSEFADAPLQRDRLLRGAGLTVDIRRTGTFDGRFWMGTSLGDVTGLAGLIQRNAAQLTAAGGSVNVQAGGSIVIRDGAAIDVSGGFFQHEGGMVRTTRLLQGGRLIDIADARPDQLYDGTFTGISTFEHPKYGITETFTIPWMRNERFEEGFVEGASGGTLALTAPGMALDGALLGLTVAGPRQRTDRAPHSQLTLAFEAERLYGPALPQVDTIRYSPTPPTVRLTPGATQTAPGAFVLNGDAPAALAAGRLKLVTLSPDLFTGQGFGHLSIANPDGTVVVPEGVSVAAPAKGSLSLSGSNITIRGAVSAAGGDLKFRVFNLSPSFVDEFRRLRNLTPQADPRPNRDRGFFTLAETGRLEASGLIADDRVNIPSALARPLVLAGGSISIEAFSTQLMVGSTIDVSGGAGISTRGRVTYGNGGSISILTGRDLSLTSVTGGRFGPGAVLSGYSGATGGSLSLRAMLIQIGGRAQFANTLVLEPALFQQGGFTAYSLTGIGRDSTTKPETGAPETYAPAISVAPGTVVRPIAENWMAVPNPPGSGETVLRPFTNQVGVRSPVSMSFAALGSDDSFSTDILEARGDIVLRAGSLIETDPGGGITLGGDTVSIMGSLTAPGGTIAIRGRAVFPLAPLVEGSTLSALPTVSIGPKARISTAGTTVLLPDAFGRRTGTVSRGGVITVFGNIVAESEATLDVSGSFASFDLSPSALGHVGSPIVPANSGVTAPLWTLGSETTRIDSAGGLIEIEGSQLLLSDATLLGSAGGPTATGGTLSVHSGRFYPRSGGNIAVSVRSTDINLVITQRGNVIPDTGITGIGRPVLSESGAPIRGFGRFAIERFSRGGFDSLELGAKFLETSTFPVGGNLQFRGPVAIEARGYLRLAAGGVLQADSSVGLRASYISIGQPFRAPINPNDPVAVFQQSPAGGGVQDLAFAPTFGSGSLKLQAGLVDIGNLSLQKIGRAVVDSSGDIRGNGTVAIRGDLTLRAAQLYPTSLSTFNLFAYDPELGSGSIVIRGGGASAVPLSVGANLNVFASSIIQDGVLRAPVGSITLGWDGKTDFDPIDSDIDGPTDPISKNVLPVAVADRVTLGAQSFTSVSATNSTLGTAVLLPYGLSPDGFSWIDPRGVNVTTGGVPEKRVVIAGESVTTRRGAVVDIGGGGDLYAYRWVPGTGGNIDRLGTASSAWSASTPYQSGDLVLFNGQTWSARVASLDKRPTIGLSWSRVGESFAVIPDFAAPFAPYNPFNSGGNATSLQGDPGYIFTANPVGDRVRTSLLSVGRVNAGMRIGDRIYLDSTPGMDAGFYTLLPRRYALMPGAFLVTPLDGSPLGSFALPDGANLASGYRLDAFSQTGEIPALRSRFEIASSAVTLARSKFENYLGNTFFSDAAKRLEIERPQQTPIDGGYLSYHGNSAIFLLGDVRAASAHGGRGAMVDVSSFADLYIIGGRGAAPAGARAVVEVERLNSWGVESLLIGGLRQRTATGTIVDVRTNGLTLNNAGITLGAPEVVLASRSALTVGAGSALVSTGALSQPADLLLPGNDGALVRVSGDLNAASNRTGLPATSTPLLTIGAGARIGGRSATLDSTAGSLFDPSAVLNARALTLGSGQISILLDQPSAGLTGSLVEQHLTISGKLLQDVQQANSLTLRSYRTIDTYGSGTFGSPALDTLTLFAAGVRGYDQGPGTATFEVGNLVLGNPSNVVPIEAPAVVSGSLRVAANTIRLGANNFAAGGYENVEFNAAGGVLGRSAGAFTTPGNLTINTPLITGVRGATQAVTAGGALVLNRTDGAVAVRGGLGSSFTFTGTTVLADTNIQLPSGEIVLRAMTGDVVVGGQLNVAGTRQEFYDLTRYSNAGRILITSDQGDVKLAAGSLLSVASAGFGKAGSISINAASGEFLNEGKLNLLGQASSDANSGTFLLDVLSAGTYANVNDPLQAGGFFNERNIRIRTGSVTIDGITRARDFSLSADEGAITVTGTIDASGRTGGQIILVSGSSLTLESNARLTVQAGEFNSAGKGGSIRLEAGAAIDGTANEFALLDIKDNATINLGVDSYVAGAYTDAKASAFRGRFQGTLHLRAPRVGNDIGVGPIGGDVSGASSILVEGFRVYDRTLEGTLDNALRDTIHFEAQSYMDDGYDTMLAKLVGANASLSPLLVLAPGVEIISRTGDLVLGTDVDDYTNDWDLSGFRYGPKQAPGVLTIRAVGNVEFKNALSDGFRGDFSPNDFGEFPPPGQELWLRPLMDISATLPVNTQSWSYRLVAGSDLSAADFRRLKPLDTLADGKGSVLVGKFYAPNLVSGTEATTAAAIDNRFQVIRTGAGNIDVAAGRDVQLRNQFATIYTAGVRLPYANTIIGENEVRLMSLFSANDFAVPLVEQSTSHVSQGSILGQFQQAYAAQYGMAGGDVTLFAQQDIGRFTLFNGEIRADSSRQLPNNWLYRRGFVDPATGTFGAGGIGVSSDLSASTTWWVDFSNFFQGFGALSGGNVAMFAGRDLINADAVAATNARMAGRDGATGSLLAPDASKLLELGGGDVRVGAGKNIDGGVYYVERGVGSLVAGGEITTNSARSPSLGFLGQSFSNIEVVQSGSPSVFDPLTWLPTTLFVGKSRFDVSAAGDVLLGPVTNPFFLPQGGNNKFWNKTYFNTYSDNAGVSVASFGGSVTHRMAVTLPGSGSATATLQAWISQQNVLTSENASFYEPWIRLAEGNTSNFSTIATVGAPSLQSTAFAGNINLVGDLNLFPSSKGGLELIAAEGVIGLQPSGRTYAQVGASRLPVTAWISASVNVSDADPAGLPGIASPLAYRALAGSSENALRDNIVNPFAGIDPSFLETGSFTGFAASAESQRALHATSPLHAGDRAPVRLYALDGDITAITLFAPKASQIAASNDITDIAFYLQNTQSESISFVAAGRDIVGFNENSRLRSVARDLAQGNTVVPSVLSKSPLTVVGTRSASLAGDIQINGLGVLEVLAGGDLDLGTGANLRDGTGTGFTSIGNSRNPFLPFGGADIIVMAGVPGPGGEGPALGLRDSSLDFEAFITSSKIADSKLDSAYLDKLEFTGAFQSLTNEQQAIVALEVFYRKLRDAGRGSATTGNYDPGFAAVDTLFGQAQNAGEIFTRTRDIRTSVGGAISIAAPGGGFTMASDIFGNPLTPPGIVSEFGGTLSIFTDESVNIGQARIFTLRGGDIVIWSSKGDIAAGSAPKTVVTAPPTRVLVDSNSADVQTDLGGLATGGGIGVLASVEGIMPGNVDLIAPGGFVDAGDAGIRATGNLSIAAVAVLNASNISVSGSSSGVPSAPTVAAPNIGGLTAASNTAAASTSSAQDLAKKQVPAAPVKEEDPSIITVEVIGYGGGEGS